ncbi:MAG: response regulator [Bdellovibrionaceae bacterium]|nr:response regulator [Bdellovibrio sp.]
MFPNDTRILIVDDMNMMRSLIKSQLRQIGFLKFFEANDGHKALSILEQAHSAEKPIQLIFADWDMPVMSGIDLLTIAKRNPLLKDIPFILITAEGEPARVKEAIALGVNSFIRKPFSGAVLLEKIESVWQSVSKKAA